MLVSLSLQREPDVLDFPMVGNRSINHGSGSTLYSVRSRDEFKMSAGPGNLRLEVYQESQYGVLRVLNNTRFPTVTLWRA